MDAWFDCAKMALSLPCKLLSRASWWAVLSLSPLTFFLSLYPFFSLLIPQMATTVSLILQRTHFARNKRILLFTDLVIYALCGFSHSFQFICSCLCVFVSASTHMWMTLQAYACACAAFTASEQGRNPIALFFFPAWCCSKLLFYTLDAISCYLETQLSIISIVAGKPQRALGLAAHFLSISNTQVDGNTKEQKLQNAVCVCVSLSAAECVDVCWSVFVEMKISRRVTENVFTKR